MANILAVKTTRKRIGLEVFRVLELSGCNTLDTARNPFKIGLGKLYTLPNNICMADGRLINISHILERKIETSQV